VHIISIDVFRKEPTFAKVFFFLLFISCVLITKQLNSLVHRLLHYRMLGFFIFKA
jgi:hypothetical protein